MVNKSFKINGSCEVDPAMGGNWKATIIISSKHESRRL